MPQQGKTRWRLPHVGGRLVAVGLVAAVLAGCSTAPLAPEGVPTDDRGRPLPTLHGVVVDEAIRPLANATVRLLGMDVEARTDAEGRYELTRATPRAEDALVAAAAAGHVGRTQQVRLSGRISTPLNFILEADASEVARVEVLQRTDVLRCQVRTALAPGTASCQPEPPVHTGDPPPPANVWVLNPVPGLAGAVVEVHWDAASQLSRDLRVRLRAPVAGGFHGELGEVHGEAVGPSPLRVEVPEAAARALPRWTALHVEVELEGQQADVPAALAYDQVYDAYATLFYVDAAPPGYTLA